MRGENIDVGKFGSPASYQIFPSISKMLCAKMCAHEIIVTHQAIASATQSPLGNNSKGPCTKLSFLSKGECMLSTHQKAQNLMENWNILVALLQG